MEKYLISFLIFIFSLSPIFSQKIVVVDENQKPIFNVSFYKKDMSMGEFSRIMGKLICQFSMKMIVL